MAFIIRIKTYLELMRWQQWIKNFFLFAAILFSKQILQPQALWNVIDGFFIFCGLSSAVYIFNDLLDIEKDKNHPTKKLRPLPSGKLSPKRVKIIFIILFSVFLILSFWLQKEFGLAALAYVTLNFLYTLWLKKIVILDVITVAANYMIRVVAGALVIEAPITPWLIVASILLALFLALGKRRYELVLLGENASAHRVTLQEYSPYFLDQLIGIVTASTIVVYSFYTIDSRTEVFLGTKALPVTIPFVLFGTFRYLYLIHQKKGGQPVTTLLTDKPLLMTILLWFLTVFWLIYL